MLYSNERKKVLCGWLKENDPRSYNASLRLQKFLFFYEGFSKVENDISDFTRLKGYKRGPVFSTVWGDYTKERGAFDCSITAAYQKKRNMVNETRAERTRFLIDSLSERELSELTHQFHIWNSQTERIALGEQQVELSEEDFNKDDYTILENLKAIYSEELVRSSDIISVGEKYFVFKKEDIPRLTPQHYDTMAVLAEEQFLMNPVFAEINEDGGLCID